ncbi:MAG: MBL fold metallo-hydrolase [Actinobacteria bacterium]|nr:MBL fold metallo-hydrolase [Actinomycetota bacterium]
MVFEQFNLGCLSLYSYLVGDRTTGRAVVVDPQRDISGYVAAADAAGVTIERVIETHFHADFLSGHLELAAATGAVISYGDVAETDFAIDPLAHGQILDLGAIQLEIRHTPGHTPESISIVISDETGPWGVLTGDAMFIGDVGRPDLLNSIGHSADELARLLYRSLHEQLLTLPDTTRVYPAHGAGSACGKHLADAPTSTIGEQRRTNYALADMDVDTFVEVVTDGQGVAPLYFSFTADTNRRERALLDDSEAPVAVTLADALALADRGAVVIDTRPPESFASGHARGSINVGLDGRFAEYAGTVIRPGDEIVVAGAPGRGTEAKVRLARIGFDNVVGAVDDIEAVLADDPDSACTSPRITAAELAGWIGQGIDVQIVDVRNPGEVVDGAIPTARNLPLGGLIDRLDELDPDRTTVVHCAGGYRSSIAASVLRTRGFATVADLIGGYDAWEKHQVADDR